MTNIDIKIPSEHTVCGRRFDAEMQYFTYHPGRRKFVAVSFFLEGEAISSIQLFRISQNAVTNNNIPINYDGQKHLQQTQEMNTCKK